MNEVSEGMRCIESVTKRELVRHFAGLGKAAQVRAKTRINKLQFRAATCINENGLLLEPLTAASSQLCVCLLLKGHYVLVKRLLEEGAVDVNWVSDIHGCSPIHVSCMRAVMRFKVRLSLPHAVARVDSCCVLLATRSTETASECDCSATAIRKFDLPFRVSFSPVTVAFALLAQAPKPQA